MPATRLVPIRASDPRRSRGDKAPSKGGAFVVSEDVVA